MYAIGDAVVYPMHGAGIIEDFKEQNIDGSFRKYCILRMPIGDLRIMLEAANIEGSNIRPVMPSYDIAKVMTNVFTVPPCPMGDNWNQRYKDNMERIKSGLLCEAAMVFRNLYCREKQRGLSSAEKKMLSNVKRILLSEIMLSYSVNTDKAEEILDESIGSVCEL